ncbi:MAG: hypothetical protein F6K14_32925 [Symploca sp. SIO2C1]|nr:hypothetical protein [Symploca sp. SIO2C1]
MPSELPFYVQIVETLQVTSLQDFRIYALNYHAEVITKHLNRLEILRYRSGGERKKGWGDSEMGRWGDRETKEN